MAWLRVKDPRGRTRLEVLEGDRVVVGRSPSCEIRVDDPDVGLRHVSILRTPRGFLIVNETASLPVWEGTAKVSNHFMVEGVEYRVGASTLTLVPHPADEFSGAATIAAADADVVLEADPEPKPEPDASTPTPPSSPEKIAGEGDAPLPPPPPFPTLRPRPNPPESGKTVPAPDPHPAPPASAPPPPAQPASDSWIWQRSEHSQSGSGPSVYSMEDGVPVVHASSQSWGWQDGQQARATLDPAIDVPQPSAPAPPSSGPAPPSSAPAPPSSPAAPPSSPVAHARQQPAVPMASPAGLTPGMQRLPRDPAHTPAPDPRPVRPAVLSPPLPGLGHPPPAVSKQLSSGHSWMWALPSSIRDTSDPARVQPIARPLLTAGLVLMLIGGSLLGTSFALGLTPQAIATALRGVP